MFSLVGRLPSMPSAGVQLPPLFGHFAGTTQPSDSLPTFMSRSWLITLLDRPVHSFVTGANRVSRFSRVEVPCISGVFDLAGPVGARDIAPTSVAFPPNRQRRHPDFTPFRGSIPRLHVPLIVSLRKVSGKERYPQLLLRACLWKCEKFEFADRLHSRRQASCGHEYVPLTLGCLLTDFQPRDPLCCNENSDTVRPCAMTLL